MSLNIFTKSGVGPLAAAGLLLHRGDGDGHVPVAGEGVVAGQVGEAVAVGVAEGLAEGVLGGTAAGEVEDAQALLGAWRGVEPGDERAAARLGLADAEPHSGRRVRGAREPYQAV